MCEQARKLCLLGATDVELADFFDVSPRTIATWKVTHPDFLQATSLGKEAADDRVERSLYNRAVGYSYEAVKIFMPAGADDPVYAPYREHVPPETAAGSLWLRNRRPDRWRDKQQIDIDTPADSPLAVLARQLAGTALRPKEDKPADDKPADTDTPPHSDGKE